MHLIEGPLLRDLQDLIRSKLPYEAVGLILNDGEVVELTNLRGDELHEMLISRAELLSALETQSSIENVVLWHSHPHGGVGPSRTDLKQKTPLPYHLILSVVNDEIVPTWY
jgi:proteasome lid subunit RPN8/RPN11